MITNLIAWGSDRHQPTYQDWREDVASPESQRPRKASWSLFGRRGRRSSFDVDKIKESQKKSFAQVAAVLLLLAAVALSGMWIFGGPMPIVSVENFNLDTWKMGLPHTGWRTWKTGGNFLENGKFDRMLHQGVNEFKRWLPAAQERSSEEYPGGEIRKASSRNGFDHVSSTATINPNVKSVGVETLERITRKSTLTPMISVGGLVPTTGKNGDPSFGVRDGSEVEPIDIEARTTTSKEDTLPGVNENEELDLSGS